MKRFVIGACAFALTIGAALAQTAPAAAPADQPSPAAVPAAPTAAPAAPAAAPAATATPAMQTGKEVRDACRTQAIQQGLKGPARRAAVQECFAKARPDLAKAQACRQEGQGKGLVGPDLKAFVKTCKAAG
jgi:hypothetical protein